jgi:hypothetical protein
MHALSEEHRPPITLPSNGPPVMKRPMNDNPTVWPDLPYASWRETAATLQLWTQIVGKIRLTLTPWLNHGWQVPLYVTAHGLT